MSSTRVGVVGSLARERYQLKFELWQVNTDPENASVPCFFRKVIQLCLYREENGASLLIGKTAVLEIQVAKKTMCVLPFREVFSVSDLADLRANLLVGGELFGSCTLQLKQVEFDGKPMRKRFRNGKGAVIASPFLSALIERCKDDESFPAAQNVPEIPFEDLSIGDRLAKGAFGEVYRGRYAATEVAIKKLIGELNESTLNSFKAEMSILAAARHPNILLLMGVCHHDGQVYMISELMEGDLARLLFGRHQLAKEQIIGLAIEAAKGLEFLHKRGILHRDIKPSNILYDKQMHIKVCDMGLARDANAMTVDMAGTPTYMAPELLNNMAAMFNHQYTLDEDAAGGASDRHQLATTKSDVYSFGVTLWELVKGEPAFNAYLTGERSTTMFFANVVRGHERPPVDDPSWPRLFVQLLSSMWHPDPSKRPEFFPGPDREREPGVLRTLLTVKDHFYAKRLHHIIPDKEAMRFWLQLTPHNENDVPFARFYYSLFRACDRSVPLDRSIVLLNKGPNGALPVITPDVTQDQIHEFLCRHPDVTQQQLDDAAKSSSLSSSSLTSPSSSASPSPVSSTSSLSIAPTSSSTSSSSTTSSSSSSSSSTLDFTPMSYEATNFRSAPVYSTPDEQLLGALSEFLCRTSDGARGPRTVSLEEFGRFVCQFGPLDYTVDGRRSTILDRFEEVAKRPYFFGNTRVTCSQDCFLIRCSIMSPRDLTFETVTRRSPSSPFETRKYLVSHRDYRWCFSTTALKHVSIHELLKEFYVQQMGFTPEAASVYVAKNHQTSSPFVKFFNYTGVAYSDPNETHQA